MIKENALLIVDDQIEILHTIERLFRREFAIFTANSGADGLKVLEREEISVILSDQRMPGMDGVTMLDESRKLQPDAVRVLITGYADIDASINAVNKAKIYQYISKPFEPEELQLLIRSAVNQYNLKKQNDTLREDLKQANQRLSLENRSLKSTVKSQLDLGNFIGHSPAIQKVYKYVKKVVNTPTTVLLLGETGTGKEMLARMIHYNGNRRDKIFLAQNCGAIPDTLLQSELFGHVKGAFTGAISNKKGLFEQADGGTIFLDEIGDTSPALQLGLLRVLQESEVKPVGGTETKHVDIRVIAATNRDLLQEVKKGGFREDLYYRLNVFPIFLPPLSQRMDDIPDLIHFFVEKYSARIDKKIIGVDKNVIQILQQASFSGNVRELENEIERMVTLADNGKRLSYDLLSDRLKDMPSAMTSVSQSKALKEAIHQLEHQMINRALQKSHGNIQKAADDLEISRVGLHKMLKRHTINAYNFKRNH